MRRGSSEKVPLRGTPRIGMRGYQAALRHIPELLADPGIGCAAH
jgi:hypothetical protein